MYMLILLTTITIQSIQAIERQPKIMLNIGQNCFANAGLQCLFASNRLTKYFASTPVGILNDLEKKIQATFDQVKQNNKKTTTVNNSNILKKPFKEYAKKKETVLLALQDIARDYMNPKIQQVDTVPLAFAMEFEAKNQQDAASALEEVIRIAQLPIQTTALLTTQLAQANQTIKDFKLTEQNPISTVLNENKTSAEADKSILMITFELETVPKDFIIPTALFYGKQWTTYHQPNTQKYNLISMAWITYNPLDLEAYGHYNAFAKYDNNWYRVDEPEAFREEIAIRLRSHGMTTNDIEENFEKNINTMPLTSDLLISYEVMQKLLNTGNYFLTARTWGAPTDAPTTCRFAIYEREEALSDKGSSLQKALQELNAELNNLATAIS
jgi:hypothetical protein